MGSNSNNRKSGDSVQLAKLRNDVLGYKLDLFALQCASKMFALSFWQPALDAGAVEILDNTPDDFINELERALPIAIVASMPQLAGNTESLNYLKQCGRRHATQLLEWYKKGSPEMNQYVGLSDD